MNLLYIFSSFFLGSKFAEVNSILDIHIWRKINFLLRFVDDKNIIDTFFLSQSKYVSDKLLLLKRIAKAT